jgi:hypothetical protein
MRHRPGFWGGVILCVAAFTRATIESRTEAMWALVIGVALVVAFFPIWRVLAARWPSMWTDDQPELLDEIQVDRPMHPEEPESNVHLVQDE